MLKTAPRQLPALAATEWLQPLPPASRWVLHGDARARAQAAAAFGVGFAESACRAVLAGERATLWLGPNEYLLLDMPPPSPGPAAAAQAALASSALAQALEAALSGIPHALVDVSHRQFALEVGGPHAAAILNGGCPLDLDLAAFPVGMCTRTVFAKADIVLWRTAPEAFHLEAWRSFSGYVSGLLSEIAREFYGPGR